MSSKKITIEQLIYLLILGLALIVRLLHLGLTPLDPAEAEWALRAHQAANGTLTNPGSQPSYVLLSGLLFSFFGSSDALARLIPALSGALLLLLPYQQRQRLGQIPALILALGLALDPGLVALSRQAGGPIMAVSFTVLAVSCWLVGNTRWAGLFLGLSLLSGPVAIYGWMLFALLWAVLSLRNSIEVEFRRDHLISVGVSAAVTLVLVGTLFLRYPQGISGIGAGLWAFLQGFGQFSSQPLLQIPLILFTYQPLVLLAALYAWRITRNERQPVLLTLKIAVILAATLLLLYPAHQTAHLAWLLLPLWALAAIGLSRMIPWRSDQRSPVMWSESALAIVLTVLFWINLSAISKMAPANLDQALQHILHFQFSMLSTLDIGTQTFLARAAALALTPLLAILTMILVGLGWNSQDARRGFRIGLLICLTAYTFSISWGASHLPERHANELWYPGQTAGNSHLMLETIGDLAEWHAGNRQAVDILSLLDNPTLQWTLRQYDDAVFNIQIPANELPSLVITPVGVVEPQLEQAYRGQSFALVQDRLWHSWPDHLLSWLVYRQALTAPQEVILWARIDLFPDGVINASTQELPAE